MIPIEDLRLWAGVPEGDDSKDETLRQIEAGIIALLEQKTGISYASPPVRVAEVLDAPEVRGGGLSQIPVDQQWVTLAEPSIGPLSGTYTLSAGSDAVTGTGAAATTELSAELQTVITFDSGEVAAVASIDDDNTFSLTAPAAIDLVDGTASISYIGIETRCAGQFDWTVADSQKFELDETGRRRIYSPCNEFPPGRRTVRATYRHGFEEGEAPDDVTLLTLKMLKSVYSQMTRRSKSVGVGRSFNVTWGSFAEEAEAFMNAACLLVRPINYGG